MLHAGLDGVPAPDPGQIVAHAEVDVERTPVKAAGGVEAAIENRRKALAGDGREQAEFAAPVSRQRCFVGGAEGVAARIADARFIDNRRRDIVRVVQ